MKKQTIHNRPQNGIRRLIPTIGAVLIGIAASPLNAQDFGVHFLGNTSDSVTGTAGVVPIGFWNNISSGSGSVTITASDGTTTATLSRTGGQAGNAWNSGLTGDGANQSLLHGYMDAGSYGGSPAILTVSGLTSSYYDVYIYSFPDGSRPQNSGDWLPNYTVNGLTYYSPVIGNATGSTYDSTGATEGGVGFTGFIQGTPVFANSNGKPNATNFGNYIHIMNVQASGGVITIEPQKDGTTYRSPFNGFELVPVASPTAPVPNTPLESPSTAYLGLGAGSMVTLTATASGSPPIAYQWQTDGGTGGALTNISGATATNLVLNTTGWLPGTYVYDFTAGNSFGTNTSTTVSILVVPTSSTLAVSVQFQGGGGSSTLGNTLVAGYVPHDNWNIDDDISVFTYSGLVDSTGAATPVTVQVNYQNGQYHSGDNSGTPDDVLMSGGFWSGGGYTVNVTGVPYSSYYVYVYMLNDNNPNRRYGLTLGSQTYWGAVFNGNTYSAPPYTLDTQTAELAQGTQMQADIVEFTDVTGSNFTITGKTPDGNVAMMGLQIVNPSAGPAVANPIRVMPGQGTIYEGLPVVLSEFAFGASTLSYQWLTDGGTGGALTNIPGANSSTLSVNTTVLASGNYNYEVIVTNASGSSTSAVTTLTITASEPVLLTDIAPTPANEAFVGQTLTYSPVFGGSLPINYQWMVDTGSGPTNIPASVNPTAVTSTLVLSNVQLSAAGTYSLSASNSVGGPVSSSGSTLTVLADPPPPAANSYGALVLSNHPVAYWRFNEDYDPSTGVLPVYDYSGNGFDGVYGQNSLNGFNGIVGPQPPEFPGFETNNFAVETAENLTNSWVTVPPLNLNTNTVTIAMWIYPTANEPQFGGLLFNRPYGAGLGFGGSLNNAGMPELGYNWNNNSEATWSFNSGLYPLVNQWSFVALVIQPNQAMIYLYYIDPNTGQPDLYSAVSSVPNIPAPFDSASVSTIGTDGGNPDGRAFSGSIDEVSVFNSALSSSDLLELFSQGAGLGLTAVSIGGQPQSESLFAGATATFSVSGILGSPPLTYQWQFNGTNINGATNTSLTITNVTAANDGSYELSITNPVGTTNSDPATLAVVTPTPNSYDAAVLAHSPLVYWKLNETNNPANGGVIAYDYINGNNGVYQTAAENGFNGVVGPESPEFSGFPATNSALETFANISSSYVTASGGTLATNNLTYVMWINPNASVENWSGLLFDRAGAGGGEGLGFGGATNATGMSELGYTWNQNSTWSFDTFLYPPTNEWSLVAMTISPSAGTVYLINSSGVQTAVNAIEHDSEEFAVAWHIGDDASNPNNIGDRTFPGSISDVSVYLTTLSSNQIVSLYNAGGAASTSVTLNLSPGPGSNLTLTWSQGTLLQATNLNGPWVTNSAAVSPYTVAPTNSQSYFKLRVR